jgi:hypothetical protein
MKGSWPFEQRKSHLNIRLINILLQGHHGHYPKVVGFTTTCVIGAFTTKVVSSNPTHGGVLDTTVCNKRQWFSLATPVSSYKTDRHHITESANTLYSIHIQHLSLLE